MFHEVFTKGLMDPDCKNNFTLPFFIDIIETIKRFEENSPEIFNDLFKIQKFEKAEILVEQGDSLNQFFFVEKGVLSSPRIA